MKQWIVVLILGLTYVACTTNTLLPISEKQPAAFPSIETPLDNELTAQRIKLGRYLFYDAILSRDSSISCASCHKQKFAFGDNLVTSFGIENRAGIQNVPSLINIAYAPYFTRAGGVPTLEMQILVPIQEHNEFDFNIRLISDKISKNPMYDSLSRLAYNRPIDYYVLTRSIAAFERSLVSANSPYDLFVYYNKKNALSKAAKRGMELFMSDKTNCSTCHVPPHFTNFAFENNGLYEVYADSGRMRLTFLESDRALFKVPSLRNVALTAPYMHDGSKAALKTVVAHYNNGGFFYPNKNNLIRPLRLSPREELDLIAFLESLTDSTILNNPAFASPY